MALWIFNFTPLHIASKKNLIECVNVLLENPKINVNLQNEILFKNLNNYQLKMHSLGIFKESIYDTPLHIALIEGFDEIVEILLKRKEIDLTIENI